MAINMDVRPGSAVVDPVDAIGALTDVIRTECAVSDATRAIPAKVIDSQHDAGVFRLLAPVELGGREVDPVTFLEVVEAASHADGSVGWCVMIGGCYATFAGMLPSEAAREIYGDPMTISAGVCRPGRRHRGRWRISNHRAMAVGQRIESRQLVRRRLCHRPRWRARHRSNWSPSGEGVLLSSRCHRDHRHLGLD